MCKLHENQHTGQKKACRNGTALSLCMRASSHTIMRRTVQRACSRTAPLRSVRVLTPCANP
jgi:hypothetical protein